MPMSVPVSDRVKGDHEFLAGGGEVAELIRNKDWSVTPLGSIDGWPQSLRTTVSLCLASNFPINIIWGPENTQIYNDGYRVVCGESHPRALGEGYDVTWQSAWPAIGPPFENARSGATSFLENQRMFLTRNGYIEEAFFTFSLSPIRDESGGIGGLFHPVTETTATNLAERRMRALRELTVRFGAASTVAELAEAAVETFAFHRFDLPFLLVYERGDNGIYHLIGQDGVPPDGPISPCSIVPSDDSPWPVREVIRNGRMLEVDGLRAQLGRASCGPYPENPDNALVIPLMIRDVPEPPVLLMLGASARLPLDAVYRGFYDLLAAAFSAGFVAVRAREDERHRAEALAAIDRAKTAFFSNVSHEFRTPLTLILGPLEELVARGEQMPEDDREHISLAHRNGLRLLKLVNTLLDFSRIEAGRTEAHYEMTDVGSFTAELASNFRSVTEQAGIDLVVDIEPVAPIDLDRDMWEKIVLNLVSNAFKFTHAGTIRVAVRQTDDRSSLELVVADSGIGIPARELPLLFDRFYRVQGAQGRSYEGSGIGLALTRELVRLHGGEIAVASELGRGSAFTVTVPLRAGDGAPAAVLPAPRTASVTAAAAYIDEARSWLPGNKAAHAVSPLESSPFAIVRSGGRVLLAEDNADMRAYVTRLLEAEGMSVETVNDGEAALNAARRHVPDLILSDVMMPKLGGFEFLAAVRADPVLKETPFVMLSARAGEEARVEGIEAGADDYLTKPFSARELIARVTANLGLARDRREEALRASEARFRSALEVDTVGAIFFDMDGNIYDANDAFFKMGGYTREDLESGRLSWQALTPPEWMAASEHAFAELKATGRTSPYEKEYIRKDGTRWWALFAAKLLPDGMGFEFVLDITDRRNAETRLRQLNTDLERKVTERSFARGRTWQLSPEIMGVLNSDGYFETSNPAWQTTLGWSEAEVANTCFFDFIHSEDLEATRRAWADTTRGQAALQFENRCRHKQGGWRWLSWVAVPDDGKVYCSARDVTLEKEQEEALAYAEEALRQSQKLDAMGQLTGGVAHDFNNLLAPIIGSLDLLVRREVGNERERRLIDAALQSAERAKTLVQRLLAFARRQPLRSGAVDLSRLIDGVTGLIETTIGPAIGIRMLLAEQLPAVHADPNQLEMALLNLGVNARDAMPEGGTLTIAGEQQRVAADAISGLGAGDYVRLSVSDTGFGMNETTRSRAIEPFFSTKGVGKGTGLGLSMVHGLALQLGGGLTIESQLGEGTTVTLWLPVSTEPVEPSGDPAAVVQPPSTRGQVLLVDDEYLVRMITADMLVELGYDVREASSATDALRLIDEGFVPDLLITDHLMPGISGAELARTARVLIPDMRVLVVSGYAEMDSLPADLPRLAKPFKSTDLAQMLATLSEPPMR